MPRAAGDHNLLTAPQRAEWITIGVLSALALLLRCMFPGRLAIEHYDEGIYAANLISSAETNFTHPALAFHAPPLLPLLIEFSLILFGTGGAIPMLPSIILGTATVPLCWWASRRWFGPATGISAAAMVTFLDMHVLYSRTALTDGPATFFLIAGVYLTWEAITRTSFRWAIAAGVVIALGWSTKYTGWLPLAISLAGTLPWVIFQWKERAKQLPSLGLIWLTMTGVAVLCWLPTWRWLQSVGGYAAISANHASYVVPWSEAWATLWQQIGNQWAFESPACHLGISLALILAVVVHERFRPSWKVILTAFLCAMPLIAAARFLTTAGLLWLLGMASCRSIVAYDVMRWKFWKPDDSEATPERSLACWMLLAWIVGLTLALSHYQPYPRLGLPLLAGCGLGAAVTIAALAQWITRLQPVTWKTKQWSLLVTVVVVTVGLSLAFAGSRSQRFLAVAWADRTATRKVAEKIIEASREASPRRPRPIVIATRSEPALYYHLSTLTSDADDMVIGLSPLRNAIDAANRGLPTFIAIGIHSRTEPSVTEALETFADRLQPVETFDYGVSEFVKLNYVTPGELESGEFDNKLELLRVAE
ncbi:ArnT family glycosyltransferase [Calycomorphotria hydatis]|uniref:Dolichyl-phosphate-mannose-protein mannosyltransferase n=1 Tax=Calycomorphotria hydatis TaxID=2528027 RepID=A0A517T4W9_9PLAN|nr:glycosyltransferase family 39 protein [Calycomorphotria hydatis]QDT63408.1 Dolichyl-phosphate-mannose-protein mannosyltransferase [Calycomorphotria hydatis]